MATLTPPTSPPSRLLLSRGADRRMYLRSTSRPSSWLPEPRPSLWKYPSVTDKQAGPELQAPWPYLTRVWVQKRELGPAIQYDVTTKGQLKSKFSPLLLFDLDLWFSVYEYSYVEWRLGGGVGWADGGASSMKSVRRGRQPLREARKDERSTQSSIISLPIQSGAHMPASCLPNSVTRPQIHFREGANITPA